MLHVCKKCNSAYPVAVSPSAHERNRVNTWNAIHESAVRLTLEVGLAGATVSAIAEAAGVSPRSFFNYFPTKEDAVLGMRPATLDPEALARFRESSDGLLRRAVLLMNTVARSMTDGVPSRDRRTLVQRYPELLARLRQHIAHAELLVLPVVTDQLAGSAAGGPDWGAELGPDAAEALVRLAGAIVRFANIRELFALGVEEAALDEVIVQFRTIMEESR